MSSDIGNIVQTGTNAIVSVSYAGAVTKSVQKAFSGSSRKSKKAPRL